MTPEPPPEWAIEAAGAALARAEIFDDRMTADSARILAWAEALATYGITKPDAMAAVTAHYQRPAADTPKPGDIIAEARKIRGERAEREKGDVAALPPANPDPQLGGLPIVAADGKPVWSAYEQHGAIDLACPTCKSKPDESCTNLATGMARKIPCTARIVAGTKAAKA